jgi:hypothetical protein
MTRGLRLLESSLKWKWCLAACGNKEVTVIHELIRPGQYRGEALFDSGVIVKLSHICFKYPSGNYFHVPSHRFAPFASMTYFDCNLHPS